MKAALDKVSRMFETSITKRRCSLSLAIVMSAAFACLGSTAWPKSYAEASKQTDDSRPSRCVEKFREEVLEGEMRPSLKQDLLNMVLTAPRWFGIPILQLPGDLVALQQIVYDVRPDFIIETGTFMGGSSLFFATLLAQIHPTGKVLTIDIRDLNAIYPECAEHLETIAAYRTHVEFIAGNSTDPEIVRNIAHRVRGHRVFVTLDSDHHAAHVLREMEAYGPLVSKGSYLIVQNTYLDQRWGIEETPIVAVRQFLQAHPEFETDYSREPYGPTEFHDGYLRRVR